MIDKSLFSSSYCLFQRIRTELRFKVLLNLAVFTCQGYSALLSPAALAARVDGKLEIQVLDSQTGEPISCRMEIKNSRGRPVRLKQPETVQLGNAIYFDGNAVLGFRRGQYTFDLDAGPEYRTQSGHFEIDRHADDSKTISMNRFADLAQEGWYAGDLAAGELPTQAIDLVLKTEKLSVVPTLQDQDIKQLDLTSFHDNSRWYAPFAGRRLSNVNGLILFKTSQGLHLKEQQSPSEFLPNSLRMIREKGATLVALSPLDLQLPFILATNEIDAFHVISDPAMLGLRGDPLYERDSLRYPGDKGLGRYAEFVYFQILETGLKYYTGRRKRLL